MPSEDRISLRKWSPRLASLGDVPWLPVGVVSTPAHLLGVSSIVLWSQITLTRKNWLLNFPEFHELVVKGIHHLKLNYVNWSLHHLKNKGNKHSKLTTCWLFYWMLLLCPRGYVHLLYLPGRHIIKWSSTVHPIPTSALNPHRPWKTADIRNHPHTPFLQKTQLANIYQQPLGSRDSREIR